ncbi:hypothetical protein CVT25_000781 [Psilocybe cyanescens]|uniref:DUF6533 domain-containing protein n=1 Tax=Psilocybe cyanescens TaxID=93625 RepID=A0A409XM24_PSICY|nr:hypothetical protein CVT25_000781 [Psilocybe cyanescens]
MANATLFSTFRDIQITQYTQLSAECIIIFDHLTTFGQEVNLIWMGSWSIGKVLFLSIRYYVLAAVMFNSYGNSFFRWQGWTSLGVTMMAEGILQIRIYALYLLNKQILAVILTLFLLSSATCAVIMGMVLEALEAKALPIPGGKFCMPVSVSAYFCAFWIPIICFEALLCALALFRGMQISKSIGIGGPATFLRGGRQLVDILFRDSLIYFIA